MSPVAVQNAQNTNMPLKVLLADDQPKVRSALRLLLEQESQWQIVGEAGDAASLLDATAKTRPDIILLDWELPDFQGENDVTNLKACCKHVKIVALSSQLDARKTAFEANVDAFVSKGDPPEVVLDILYSLDVRLMD